MKNTTILFALLFSAGAANAKISHNYRVLTTVKNSAGQFMEFAKAFSGWRCYAGADTKFSEVMIDHRGDRKRVEQKRSSDFVFSTLWQGQPSYQYDVERNFNNDLPEIAVSVYERCENSKTVSEYVTKSREVPDGTDANGNTTYRTETYQELESVTKTVYAHQRWNCRFNEMPNKVQESLVKECRAEREFPWLSGDVSDFYIEDALLIFMNDKDIKVDLKLLSEVESFIDINKPSAERQDRFVFNLSQGVRSGLGEDDFVFNVKINGETAVQRSIHGLINEDFVYFAGADEKFIDIEVAAVEEDLIFDDHYATHTKARLYRSSDSERTILLNRGPYHSNLKVNMLVSPPVVKLSGRMDAQVSAQMQAQYLEKKKSIEAEVHELNELELALKSAEDNYDLAKMISIPVTIVGASITAFGAYKFKGAGLNIKTGSMIFGGLLAVGGGVSYMTISRAKAMELLKKLINVRKNYENLLNELDEKALRLHENTDYSASKA